MDYHIREHLKLVGENVVQKLNRNGFTAEFFQHKEQAARRILEWVPAGSKVGLPGSVTIQELGVLPQLRAKDCILLDMQTAESEEEKIAIGRQQLTCDVLLTSTNALTEDGVLYNVDATGNRVAAMIFGPRLVIIVAGVNKLVPDLATAEKRVSSFAAPANNRRLNYPNPCTITGQCMDCKSKSRICNTTVIMRYKPKRTDIRILIVGEYLGY